MPRLRLIRPAAAVLLAAVALAGCKSQGPERAMARFYGDGVPAASARAYGASAATATPAETGASPGQSPQTASRPDPAGPAASDAIGPAPNVDARPDRFHGLTRPALDAELGPPALVRTEGPARVWQYRGRACVLDLVLYPGPDGPTVRHLEARDPVDAEPRDAAGCLEQLLQRRALAATG